MFVNVWGALHTECVCECVCGAMCDALHVPLPPPPPFQENFVFLVACVPVCYPPEPVCPPPPFPLQEKFVFPVVCVPVCYPPDPVCYPPPSPLQEKFVFPVSLCVTRLSGTGPDCVFLGVVRPMPTSITNVRVWVAPTGVILCTDQQFSTVCGIPGRGVWGGGLQPLTAATA